MDNHQLQHLNNQNYSSQQKSYQYDIGDIPSVYKFILLAAKLYKQCGKYNNFVQTTSAYQCQILLGLGSTSQFMVITIEHPPVMR